MVIFKRDSSPKAILALPGQDPVYQDGSAAPAIALNGDGTIVVANDPGINYWGGSGVEPSSVGESCAAFAWPRDSASV